MAADKRLGTLHAVAAETHEDIPTYTEHACTDSEKRTRKRREDPCSVALKQVKQFTTLPMSPEHHARMVRTSQQCRDYLIALPSTHDDGIGYVRGRGDCSLKQPQGFGILLQGDANEAPIVVIQQEVSSIEACV